MKRVLITIVVTLLFFSVKVFSQTNDEILSDLKNLEEKSSFRVGLGIGNKVFSTHNNTLNAQQNNSSIVFTPSVGYYHKSGLSLTATGYALNSGPNSGFLQYAINPAYDYTSGENINASISYTHYFVYSTYASSLTPIQNDFFGSLSAKKGVIQPGAQIGYASGKYKEITNVDTLVKTGPGYTHYKFVDTSSIQLTSFNLSGTLEHTFSSKGLFVEKDGIAFIPQLMVNFGAGTEKILQSTSGNYSYLVARTKTKKRNFKKKNASTSNSPFTLQSVALNLEAEYSLGNFTFEPNAYFDYYIPATTSKRFTKIFSLNFYYSF